MIELMRFLRKFEPKGHIHQLRPKSRRHLSEKLSKRRHLPLPHSQKPCERGSSVLWLSLRPKFKRVNLRLTLLFLRITSFAQLSKDWSRIFPRRLNATKPAYYVLPKSF